MNPYAELQSVLESSSARLLENKLHGDVICDGDSEYVLTRGFLEVSEVEECFRRGAPVLFVDRAGGSPVRLFSVRQGRPPGVLNLLVPGSGAREDGRDWGLVASLWTSGAAEVVVLDLWC